MRSQAHILRNCLYKEWIPKSGEMLHEESEEAIVLMTDRTTKPVKKEGPLLQPCRARR
jgi:hypothetical protein